MIQYEDISMRGNEKVLHKRDRGEKEKRIEAGENMHNGHACTCTMYHKSNCAPENTKILSKKNKSYSYFSSACDSLPGLLLLSFNRSGGGGGRSPGSPIRPSSLPFSEVEGELSRCL